MLFKQKTGYIALGVVLVMVGLLGMGSFSLAQGDAWTTKSPMPSARGMHSAGVVDGKIYMIGGKVGVGVYVSSVETVEEYDPATDTWTKKADIPRARSFHSASVVDGIIYVIGGGTKDSTLAAVEAYDPATDTWTRKADMPTARCWLSTSVVDGKIYAIGGGLRSWPPGVPTSTVEEYDPATDAWAKKVAMPTARNFLSTSVVDGKIYAIGGGKDSTGPYLSIVEEYDPTTDTWTKKAAMPTARGRLSTCVVDGKIYAIGGSPGASADLSAVEAYDPVTDTWTRKDDMPRARCWLSTSVVNGKIYAIGGRIFPSASMVSTVQAYDARLAMQIESLLVSATETFGATWVGQPTPLEVTVVLDPPLETIESLRQMILDLSPLGIPSDLPLEHIGDGRYTASTTITPLRNGHYDLPILVESTEGEQYRLLIAALDVYPEGDEYLYQDQMGAGWEVKGVAAEVDTQASDIVHQGNYSQAINSSGGYVQYTFEDPDGLPTFGYTALLFWINPGTSSTDKATLGLMTTEGCQYVKLEYHLGITLEPNVWQVVSIPLEDFGLVDTRLKYIQLRGVEGTFYIDDMRLVAQCTSVEALEGKAIPSGYALCQNVPNPFNPITNIGYDLPQAGAVRLSVYNVLGQMVRTLVDGQRPAGTYSVVWDGRDGTGRDVASGVYLVRLKVKGQHVQTRRMVLLR